MKNRFERYLEHRVRIILQDSRYLVGTLKAFDKDMNIVLLDCVEFRVMRSKAKPPEKRVMGFVLLRGQNMVSLAVVGPPPTDENLARVPSAKEGAILAAGRGVPIQTFFAPGGLLGPVTNGGGPGQPAMMPIGRGGIAPNGFFGPPPPQLPLPPPQLPVPPPQLPVPPPVPRHHAM